MKEDIFLVCSFMGHTFFYFMEENTMKKLLALALTIMLIVTLIACSEETPTLATVDLPTQSIEDLTEETVTESESIEEDNSASIPEVSENDSPSKTTAPYTTTKKPTTTTKKPTTTPKTTTSKNNKHSHNYSDATCTQPAKCSCGATKGSALGHSVKKDPAVAATCTSTGLTEGSHCSRCNAVIEKQTTTPITSHNYQNGICTVCKKADPNNKSKEIAAENERHTQEVQKLKENRDYLINLNQGRINDIKSQYGISYVYDDITCAQEISSLRSQVYDLDYQISRLELYNDPSDRAQLASLRQQKNSLEQKITKYEQMRKINSYQNTIESTENNYQNKLAEENSLHQQNLTAIEAKYV